MAKRRGSSLLWVTFAMVALLLAGCSGFFVNPSMTALAVSPAVVTLTQEVGTPPTCPSGSICTQQMSAIATFSDGTTSAVSASWQSSDTTVAGITSTGGLVTAGTNTGQASITAAAGTLTATASVTVTPANLVSITVTPSSAAIAHSGGTFQFTANGTLSDGTTIPLTTTATWKSSATSVATVGNGTTGGLATAGTVTATQTTNITASETLGSGTVITSNTAVLTVNP